MSNTVKTQLKGELKQYKLKPLSKLTRLGWGAIFTHIGTLVIVGLYYLLFEVNPHMNNWWHTTVSNGDLRHAIRNVAEGVLGALLAKAIMWNHFSKKGLKSGRVYDWLKAHTHLPEAPTAILSFVLVAGGIFAAGWALLGAFHLHVTEAAVSGGVWAHVQTIWTRASDQKLLAFVAAFVGARALHNLFDDIQGYLAGRRAATKGSTPRLYPANYRNRVRYFVDNPDTRVYGKWAVRVIKVGIPVGIGLAAFGYYVLAYIA